MTAQAGDSTRSDTSRVRAALGVVRTSSLSSRLGIVGALVLIVAVTTGFHPQFLSIQTLSNITQQAAFFGIMSIAVVFLLAMGEVDLSVGGTYMLSAVVAALAMRSGLNPWVGAILGIAVGAALGAANGVLATVLRVPVIIITLGTLTLYRGVGLIVSGSDSVSGLPLDDSFFTIFGASYLGFPAISWVFLLTAIASAFVFTRGRFGFSVRAIGSNRHAAVLSGYPTARILVITTATIGAFAGLSAVMTVAFFGSADPNLGTNYELNVLAAAIIGGTALTGGSGTILGAVVGALVIATINASLLQFGVSPSWGTAVTGAVIVLAVALDAVVRRVRSAR